MKTLLKYKIKSVLPAFIIGGVILLAAIIMVFVDMSGINPYMVSFGTFFMERIADNLMLLPIALIPISVSMGIVLTQEYGERDKEDFLSGLPYTRDVRFMACILPGVIFFLVFGIILIIAVGISHSLSYDYYSEINMMAANYEKIMKLDSVGNAVLRIVQIILSMLMLYFISVFAGVVGKNKMITVLIIAAICVFPMYVPEALNKITGRYFGVRMPLYDEIVNYSSLMGLSEETPAYHVGREWYTYFNYLSERTASAGIMSVVFAVISYVLAAKADRLNGKILVNKVCEIIFIIITGLYGACVVPVFRDAEKMNAGVMLASMLVVFIVIEIVLYKFVTGKGRYSYLNAGGEQKV